MTAEHLGLVACFWVQHQLQPRQRCSLLVWPTWIPLEGAWARPAIDKNTPRKTHGRKPKNHHLFISPYALDSYPNLKKCLGVHSHPSSKGMTGRLKEIHLLQTLFFWIPNLDFRGVHQLAQEKGLLWRAWKKSKLIQHQIVILWWRHGRKNQIKPNKQTKNGKTSQWRMLNNLNMYVSESKFAPLPKYFFWFSIFDRKSHKALKKGHICHILPYLPSPFVFWGSFFLYNKHLDL